MRTVIGLLTSSIILGIGLVGTVLGTATNAWAQEGRIDSGFGNHGRVVTEKPFYFVSADPKGGISLVGASQVTRLLSNGEPNPLFGTSGSEVLPETIEGSPYLLSALAVDQQDRMVLFGSAFPAGYPSVGREPGSVEITRGLVMRLKPEGGLDPSFNEGKGAVVSAFGLASKVPELSEQPTTSVIDGLVDSQDRPVFIAGVADSFSPCISHGFYASFARALVRLAPSGSVDSSFGAGDGISPVLRNLDFEPSPMLSLTEADQPLVAGAAGSHCAVSSLALRFTAAGKPLRNYGSHGRFHFPFKRFGSIAAVTASGGLILRQGVPVAANVLRVTPGGSIDRRFGVNGFAAVSMPGGTNRALRPVGVDARGRVLLVGSYSRPAAQATRKRAFLMVERLLRSGKPDPGFGSGGIISTPIAAAQVLGGKEAALDPQGRLLVLAGVRRSAPGNKARSVLTRFRLGA
jgi:uncharacterized delta-60 repeat protein